MSFKNNPLVTYFRKSYQEMEKVTWLTKKQMVNLSLIIIAVSVAVTGLLAFLDYIFSRGYIQLIEKLSN